LHVTSVILAGMKQEIAENIAQCVKQLFAIDEPIEISHPDIQFGDYATNIALQLAKKMNRNPREVAEQLTEKLRTSMIDSVSQISVAGPGFINFTLNDPTLWREMYVTLPKNLEGLTIVVEYSDPNPFKVLHAGHLYTSVVGDSISNIMAAAGAEVHRVNFGGDVGLHVAKTMWAILRDLGGEYPEKLDAIPIDGRSEWMAEHYVTGTRAYDEDEDAKAAIVTLNKRIYQLFADNDHDSSFARIYWTCRQWSYDYFDAFYARIGTPFEKYYPESEVAPLGLQTVREQLQKGVYQESDGAVVFNGQKYGLHTRVFINSQGLPTYEAKDVGLIMKKWQDYHFDRSVVITGNDIEEYMKVVLKSVEQFEPELVARTTHFTHGNVKLSGGVKMSSRKGNFLRAIDVLDATKEANKAMTGLDDEKTVLGAVKYAFLKQRIGADVIFEPRESVSLEGNSGPYLQYAHARARSILRKATDDVADVLTTNPEDIKLETDERTLVGKIARYPEVIELALQEYMPHHIATYLYELAQIFNRFYEHTQVLNNSRSEMRLVLVKRYADTLRNGLGLLGITAPDKM
jgi:arginyl-tRNA synthetase